MDDVIYRLADGRLWDVKNARWIEPIMTANEIGGETPQGDVIDLVSADGQSDEEYLAKTLAFYDYPLGELAAISPKGIKEELARLDAVYLTPRVLAGLATGDEYAAGRWREHEEKADPLRKRLEELESN